MPVFVALLRGVNVGRAKRVSMVELRALLQELEYARIVTVLNSGNVVFRASSGSAASHGAKIASANSERLKIDVPVVVKSAREFSAIVAENPLATAAVDPSHLLVAFAQDGKALSRLALIGAVASSPDEFAIGRNAAYLSCPSGILQSKTGRALLGEPGNSATTRNWATVLKLHALLDGDA